MIRIWALAGAVVWGGGLVATVPAAAQGISTERSSAASCAALGRADLSAIVDAPTQVLEARFSAASGDQPTLCQVSGTVSGRIGFELHLPVDRWNGKMLQAGCAGFCGRNMAWYCRDATARGYACVVSDMGHRSALASPTAPSLNAQWAQGDDRAQIDHGFRAVHSVTTIGKAIVEKFYGSVPKKAYFNGCSEGGREALVAAQRFPWDFDGIIAGAPAMDPGRLFMSQIWNNRAMIGEGGQALFSHQNLALVRSAVLKACDGNDGLADGVIGDPRLCRFEPKALLCKAANIDCLSGPQVAALENLLGGPRNARGQSLAPGLTPGVDWAKLMAPGTAGRSVPGTYGEEFYRYLGFSPAPGAGWQASAFDFDRDYQRSGVADALLSATNPDLRRFKQGGGKLILFHGWDDYLIAPGYSTDYYETVRKTMGGQVATDAFMRLYMVPGMDHCALGNGAWAIDFLTYLENWVEKGQAPEQLLAIRPKLPADPMQALAQIGRFPVPADAIKFARPVMPYPQTYRYRGKGDPNLAENFVPNK